MKKKISKIFVYGNFNIIHPGHLRLLKFAKSLGDQLIVGVYSDKIINDNTILNQKYRLDAIKNLSIVNKALIINNDIENYILKIKPDVVVKGKEHEKQFIKEEKVIKKIGSKLIFSSGVSTFDNFIFDKNNSSNHINNIPENYLKRHKISKHSILNNIKKFKNLNVIVVGDLIIDEVISCDTIGLSQEYPSLVVSPNQSKKFLGGAGIVAAHCAAFTKNTHLFSIGNNNKDLIFLKNKLDDYKINSQIFTEKEFTNNYKKKYFCESTCLLKVSDLNNLQLPIKIENKIYNEIKKIIKSVNVIIISDFNYGCLSTSLIEKIINLSNKNNVITCVDSQSSSQIGDILKFKNTQLISSTEREARLALKNSEDGLIEIAEKIYKETSNENIVIKLNKEGVIIHSPKEKNNNKFYTDRLPALNKSPLDTSGAGDSFLCGSALALGLEKSIWEASLIGSIFSAYQVDNIGNVPLDKVKIFKDFKK